MDCDIPNQNGINYNLPIIWKKKRKEEDKMGFKGQKGRN